MYDGAELPALGRVEVDGLKVRELIEDVVVPCRARAFLISDRMVLAFSMDMPQKSGTKCMHCW